MKECPILFSAPMVRAILEGRKTQTRRIIKPQPVSQGMMSFGEAWKWNEGGKNWFSGVTADQIANPNYGLIKSLPCPHGVPGDRLWVRETFQNISYKEAPEESCILYRADGEEHPPELSWRPSIFMPRVFSRITLDIAEVRVQRLQDISGEDAIAEGITIPRCGCEVCAHSTAMCPADASAAILEYAALWRSINGAASWEANPWVWAITFPKFEVSA